MFEWIKQANGKLKMYILITFTGVWAFSQSLRMMTQWIIAPGSIYPAPVPWLFDFWFDWTTGALLGFSTLVYGIYKVHKRLDRMEYLSNETIKHNEKLREEFENKFNGT